MRRKRSILLVGLATLTAALSVLLVLERQEWTNIRVRYGEMTTALTAKDTNAIVGLIAPAYRGEFDEPRRMRIESFAKPLGPRSRIVSVGNKATVWPDPNWYFCGVWPIGDTVEMSKVGGRWFFTGKVHLD